MEGHDRRTDGSVLVTGTCNEQDRAREGVAA